MKSKRDWVLGIKTSIRKCKMQSSKEVKDEVSATDSNRDEKLLEEQDRKKLSSIVKSKREFEDQEEQ